MTGSLGRFAVRNGVPITFIAVMIAFAGAYAAMRLPSALFPQTDFPRVIIMADNGVMPADEMMATITRPIEQAVKGIQGAQTVRSSTGRGTAEIDIFFSWDTDMRRAELDTQARLGQLRAQLPPGAATAVSRMTFSVFPIIGLSLTGPGISPSDKWETAEYDIKPRILQIAGVSKVELVGGPGPEYIIAADPQKLANLKLDLPAVLAALRDNNLVSPAGMHQEDNRLFLTVTDGRLRNIADIENFTVPAAGRRPVPIKDFAAVSRGPAPSQCIVTADGSPAVLLNIFSQPDGSTLDIARQVQDITRDLRGRLPAGMQLAYFYDQSLLVRSSVRGVWESIGFGLILSALILFLFLKDWPMTLTAMAVIPITVLATVLVMLVCGQSFNLMTLGGIAAAIGLVIDDAIVVVEAIYARRTAGLDRLATVEIAVREILPPLIGSTLTPVVVFIPLAFLTGVAGVFFRALALTMVVALLASLVLALLLTPTLAAWVVRPAANQPISTEGFLLRRCIGLYERVVRSALDHRWLVLGICLFVICAAATGYTWLKSDFLPHMDEGGFIIDYIARPGISLHECDRQMQRAEAVLHSIPEIQGYSRRTGAALGVGLVEPNTGDFLVMLRPDRTRSSGEVIADLRRRLLAELPQNNVEWEFPGILTDLIGDLTWSDEVIEVKVFSTDPAFLKQMSSRIEEQIEGIPGLVDVNDGLFYTGPSISMKVRAADAQRFGLSAADIGDCLRTALLGQTSTHVLEGDRVVDIRVKADLQAVDRIVKLRQFPLRVVDGKVIRLDQVADITDLGAELELHRDNLRQMISVTANLQNLDTGTAMRRVQQTLAQLKDIPPSTIEYGGLYQQQQESFANLTLVLLAAISLVFVVALIEFRSFREPIAIVSGAALSLFGIVAALLITGTTLNIVTFLGAIIGMGIVHKNGLLMMDHAKRLISDGLDVRQALVLSGRRRLRPVLMTSLAAALGMLPLAWGFGSAQMLRPLAIAVIGAVAVSVLLSLVATPVVYYLLAGPVVGFLAHYSVGVIGQYNQIVSALGRQLAADYGKGFIAEPST